MIVAKALSGAAGLRVDREGTMQILQIVAAMGLALAGCAAQQPRDPPPATDAQRLHCEMQARQATGNNPNAFLAGYEQASLRRNCIDLATMENFEALQALLGFRIGGNAPPATPAQGAVLGGFAEACGETQITTRLRASLERQLPAAALAAAWDQGRAAIRAPNAAMACAAARAAFRYGARQAGR